MSLDGAPLWTGEQHAWLRALGHTVWVPGQLAAPQPPTLQIDTAPAAAPPARRPPMPQDVQRDVAPPPRRPAPAAPNESAPAAAAPARRGPARGSLLPDRLRIAVLRASGLNPSAPESEAIMATWPDMAALRGNPAAKRALWLQLRALRRKGTP